MRPEAPRVVSASASPDDRRLPPVDQGPALTIVTPSFEKHAVQFEGMIASLGRFCLDLASVELVLIIEEKNEALFSSIFSRHPTIRHRILFTEDVLSGFGIGERPGAFLSRIGKFTFQSLKKFGGLLAARSDWSLVLDSETVFHKPFRALQLLDDYQKQKYVFYTWTAPRGALWRRSTGFRVTENCARALAMRAGDRWYMEYFHWFYETSKVRDLVENQLGRAFFEDLAAPTSGTIDYFENILYYLYLQKCHSAEYEFIDFKKAIDDFLPEAIGARYRLSELPFSLFGNEYLLNILSPSDVAALAPLFDRYKLPFVRLEPPYFSANYLPELIKLPSFVATISSHHLMWLRKRVAVCVSGEFRHVVHRTPEQHVRHLQGFLSGVDCDIYLHGWSNSSEALIVDALKPRAYKFEKAPSFASLARRIAVTEPLIKPHRDEGSLAMLYGIEQAFGLMEEHADEYDYVLRIRPDIYSELSLKEILVRISDEGDFLPKAIYFPALFHSKGINDQIALGPVDQMRTYGRTFSYVAGKIDTLFFNPETVLLRNLLDHGVELALVEMPYALLREVPLKIGTVHDLFHRQFHTWWSRTEKLPFFEDLTPYFVEKLAAVDAMMRNEIPDLVYIRVPLHKAPAARAVIRAKVVENDPSRSAAGLFRERGTWRFNSFAIENGGIQKTAEPGERHLFLFKEEENLIMSEWRMDRGKLVNSRVVVAPADVAETAQAMGIRISLPFYLERRQKARRAAERRRIERRKRFGERVRRGMSMLGLR